MPVTPAAVVTPAIRIQERGDQQTKHQLDRQRTDRMGEGMADRTPDRFIAEDLAPVPGGIEDAQPGPVRVYQGIDPK